MSGKSEVAKLLAQIDEECEAAKRALGGTATVGGHAFIARKMDIVGEKLDKMASIVGKEKALQLVAQQMEKSQS
jgi:DNA-binding phage protein